MWSVQDTLVCSFESGLILERYVKELKEDIGLFPHAEIEYVEGQMDVLDPVSYTHLTLPTILLV